MTQKPHISPQDLPSTHPDSYHSSCWGIHASTSDILASEIDWHAGNSLQQHLLELDDNNIHTFSYHEQWWHSQLSCRVWESIKHVIGWHQYSLEHTQSWQGGPIAHCMSSDIGFPLGIRVWWVHARFEQLCKSDQTATSPHTIHTTTAAPFISLSDLILGHFYTLQVTWSWMKSVFVYYNP